LQDQRFTGLRCNNSTLRDTRGKDLPLQIESFFDPEGRLGSDGWEWEKGLVAVPKVAAGLTVGAFARGGGGEGLMGGVVFGEA
jgi:hypothetical protein